MDGWITIGTKIDTKSFEAQTKYIEKRMEELEHVLSQPDTVMNLEKVRAEYEKLGNQLVQINKKQQELSSGSKTGIDNMVKKVGKWALAVFGVRSAYMGIRQAISYVSQYNEDMANKIESIKYSLASAIEPILTRIVNIVYVLLQYVQYIIKAWTGKDIFANASKNLSGANKNAKELKKTMAGFDTANVLSSSESGSDATGTSGIKPMTALGDGEIPNWLKWIGEHGEDVAIIIGTITTALILLKFTAINPLIAVVGGLLAYIVKEIVKNWDSIVEFTKNLWNSIKEIFSNVGTFFKDVFGAAYNAVVFVFSKIGNFFSGLWNGIKKTFTTMGKAVGQAFGTAFKTVINGVLATVETILNLPIKAINKLLNVINTVPGVNISKLDTFNLPRLATGGIVNNPGRGVPIGSAIVGEAGREGVLPLTDSQAMAQLGAEIGKWITLNVDLTTKLDSRVLSRSLEKVNNTNSFVRNGAR